MLRIDITHDKDGCIVSVDGTELQYFNGCKAYFSDDEKICFIQNGDNSESICYMIFGALCETWLITVDGLLFSKW